MGLRLKNSSGNYVELNAPSSIATDFGLTLPVNDGNASQYLQTDGAGTLSWQTVSASNLTRLTAVDTSSGDGDITNTATVYDNLPSTVKRITFVFYNVSGNAATDHLRFLLRTGSGTDVTSGYQSVSTYLSGGGQGNVDKTNSFVHWLAGAAEHTSGIATFTNVSGNLWVFNANGAQQVTYTNTSGGYVDTGAQVTGIKMYLGNGNDFDSGTVNVFYEV